MPSEMSVITKWLTRSERRAKIWHLLAKPRCDKLLDCHISGGRQYGVHTPVNQARMAASNTRSVKSSTKSITRQELTPASIAAVTEARQAALQASRLQIRMESEMIAEKTKIDGKEYQKRYNTAARKWVSTIIALPILIVTSYYLFDRRKSSEV